MVSLPSACLWLLSKAKIPKAFTARWLANQGLNPRLTLQLFGVKHHIGSCGCRSRVKCHCRRVKKVGICLHRIRNHACCLLKDTPLVPGEFLATAVIEGMPEISLGHEFSDQHEGVVFLAHAQEQHDVVVSQPSKELDLALEVLYLLPGFLPQHLDCHGLAAKTIGFVNLSCRSNIIIQGQS